MTPFPAIADMASTGGRIGSSIGCFVQITVARSRMRDERFQNALGFAGNPE
jgi:hypothetical protein